jgi:hypothetical protein
VRTAVRAVAAAIHRELVPEARRLAGVLVGRDGSLERVEWGEAFGGWFARPRFVPLVSRAHDAGHDRAGRRLRLRPQLRVRQPHDVRQPGIDVLPSTVVRVTTTDGIEDSGGLPARTAYCRRTARAPGRRCASSHPRRPDSMPGTSPRSTRRWTT